MADLLTATARELDTLKPITRLDEYIHFRSQLKAMRARNDGTLYEERLAMEVAVLMRLHEYDESIGMPPLQMPHTGGRTDTTND